MNLLDDLPKIKSIDKSSALESIKAFPQQIKDSWDQFAQCGPGLSASGFDNIILVGMGGSALAGRVVKDLFADENKFPFEVVTEYSLPRYVNQRSLVLVSSYSGNTEETISAMNEALDRGSKVFAITTGGQVGQMIAEQKLAGFIFKSRHNPLGFPKTALGYSLGSLLAALSFFKVLKINDELLDNALKEFVQVQKSFRSEVKTKNNPAKETSLKIQRKVPLLVASQHLKGSAYCARNQIHEISHHNALFFDLPEMNHHQVEALGKPESFRRNAVYLFIISPDYHQRNLRRYQITSEILTQQEIEKIEYRTESKSGLAQAMEIINLGGFISFYLSIANQEDPGPEPRIIYLKEKLNQ